MKLGIYLPNFGYEGDGIDHADRLRTWIVGAEAEGLDSIWVTDHLLRARDMYNRTWLEPMTSLAFAAALTTKPLLGPGVLLLPLRQPVLLAKMAVTLQALSNGRFIFAVGTGWYGPEFEATGTTKKERGPRTDEVLQLVKRLAGGETVTHEGQFFRLHEVRIEPSPVPMPVWVGGGSQIRAEKSMEQPRLVPSVARRIAAADGWFVRPTAEPEQIADDWRQLQPYIEQAGRRPEDIELAHGQLIHLTSETDRTRALEEQHAVAADILGTNRPREQLERSYLFGTIDEIVENCRRRAAVGVEHLILHPLTDDPVQFELMARELFPRLRELEIGPRIAD